MAIRNLPHLKIINSIDVSLLSGKQLVIHSKYPKRNFHNAYNGTRSCTPQQYDIGIVGGGIIGMATARELIQRHPSLKFVLVEKENECAQHQSGRNSGVVHAGIYYPPGSLKARLCVEGMKLMYDYCDERHIPYIKCGKLIVATTEEEVRRLEDLYERAQQNNVPDIRILDSSGIKEIEPNCRGLKAIHSPHTGIIDYARVTRSYADDFVRHGGRVLTGYEVTDIRESQTQGDYPVTLVRKTASDNDAVRCKYVVTCGGLYSDVLARMSGCSREPKIVPFRGDYLVLKPGKENLVRGNIYPVPNPKLPFLGVHFTPRMDGSVWLGPGALLAFRREGYHMGDVNFRELLDALTYRGLQRLLWKHKKVGVMEVYRSAIRTAQVRQLQKFVPSLTVNDVERGPSGVRAQALDRAGNLVDDFIVDSGTGALTSRVIHVRNAPSPAATSSLAFAKMVADAADRHFHFLSL